MDWALHKARHLVENAFAKLEQFRTVATRFDKLKQSYENTVALACAYLCHRKFRCYLPLTTMLFGCSFICYLILL